jgi:hypothetical protein
VPWCVAWGGEHRDRQISDCQSIAVADLCARIAGGAAFRCARERKEKRVDERKEKRVDERKEKRVDERKKSGERDTK